MLERRGVSKRFPPEQTRRWLTFIAAGMQQHHQTTFFLEDLQPDWLADRRRQLLCRLSVLLLFWLLGGPLGALVFGLSIGMVFALLSGLLFWLLFGLGSFPHHFALRFWLWHANCLPWNLVAFLDEAAERLLLRRVGGGYSFVHRLLLDYFADLEKKGS